MIPLSQDEFDCSNFVKQARTKGVFLAVKEDQISVWGPQDVLREADFISVIKENKRVLRNYLQNCGNQQKAAPSLETCPEKAASPFPLTDIQRAYWIGRQKAFDLGDVAIHFYTEVDCQDLDPARLQAAWNRTIRRHGMLRAIVDEQGRQRILPEVPEYEIALSDLSVLSEEAQNTELAARRDAMSHRVHRTDVWPAFELSACRLSGNRFRLFYSQDLLHIDGGSLLIVLDDLSTWYEDPAADKSAPGLTFRDYVEYEIAQKDTPAYQADLDYWREEVKTLPPPPKLPERPGGRQSGRFERCGFTLDTAEHAELRRQSAALNITPTGYVMAAFASVLAQWNGGRPYSLNVTLFNRPQVHPDINKIAGDFTSMVPVAVRPAADQTMAASARTMRKELWRHLGHRTVSGVTILDLIREAAGYHEAAELSIVFTSLLNLDNQGFSNRYLSVLGDNVFTLTQTPQVMLDHQVAQTSCGSLAFTWDFVADCFPEGMVASMFAAYETLIRRLVRDEAYWHATSPCHLPEDQARLFDKVNDTRVDWPADQTLRDLVYAQTAALPDEPAVKTCGVCLSYGALADAAERLAVELTKVGVTPGSKVGICTEKSWRQPVAVLAVQLAGAAYVPIDPESPVKRIRYICQDADISVVLVDQAGETRIAGTVARPLAVSEALLAEGPSPGFSAVPLQPSDVSHVIYTSGSTGQPKGVVIDHANVVNRILDINTRFSIGRGDAILGLTALHHDLSVYDIFGILAAGATLVLPESDSRLDPAHWTMLMAQHKVTLWNSVPAFAVMLADYLDLRPDAAGAIPLRWMILAGDWIPVPLPNRLQTFWPGLDFIASGGPTETTIWDIWNRVGEVDTSRPSIPYGKPLANATYHVIGEWGQRCPVWVQGELWIGGAGVTRGYLNQPDITSEKYVTHPETGQRFFRSGDLGRYLPDGSIEFLGRNDFQVQINGQRIELGEIEKIAQTVAGVKDCVAVVRRTDQGPALALFAVEQGRGPASDARSAADLAEQEAAFVRYNVTATDPAERLAEKLLYKALVPRQNADLIPLAPPQLPRLPLKSHRTFAAKTITPETLSEFLAPLKGEADVVSGEVKFQYGSAGGLYPVQVYLYLKDGAVKGMVGGFYRYYPIRHALEFLVACALPDDIHWAYNRPMGLAASMYIYLIAAQDVIARQYSDLAMPMCYLEAGMMSQRMRHAALETGIGVCSVGEISFLRYADKLRLTPDQVLLTAMVAGPLPTVEAAGADTSAQALQAVTKTTLAECIRAALSEQLPRHMIPSTILCLPHLPLTANGKVDRKTLMIMELAQAGEPAARQHVVPEGDFEKTVVEVLAGLLSHETISVTDNFFDLGANSARLVKAHQAIQAQSGVVFPLISMFRFPTVRSLARSLAQGTRPISDAASDAVKAASERAEKQKTAIANLRKLQRKQR